MRGPWCPDLESIAAFVDGYLEGERHEQMIEHLSRCEECYVIFVDTYKFVRDEEERTTPPPRWRQPAVWMRTGAVVAALAVTAAGSWFLADHFGAATTGDRMAVVAETDAPSSLLAEATAATRPVEPRLAGLDDHAPVAAPTRSAVTDPTTDPERWGLFGAADRIYERVLEDRSSGNLSDLGAAHLLLENLDEAVATLEEADTYQEAGWRVDNDLAAALYARGTHRDEPIDLVTALEHVERSRESAPEEPAVLFNRALILEALHLREPAIEAWKEFLSRSEAIADDTGWAEEAQSHLDALGEPTPAERWPEEREAMLDAAARGDGDAMRPVVERYPEAVRELLDERLLPEWGEAVLRGDEQTAENALASAEVVAAQLASVSGDRVPIDAVAAVRRARDAGSTNVRELAAAHRDYAEAQRLYDRTEFLEARQLFESAEGQFAATRSPYDRWARFWRLATDHNRRALDLDDVSSFVEELGESGDAHLRALGTRLRGLSHGVRRDYAAAITDYRAALALFDRLDQPNAAAHTRSVIAEMLSLVGDTPEAWQELERAMRVDDAQIEATKRLSTSILAAQTAVRAGLDRTAVVYHDRAVEIARRTDSVANVALATVEHAKVAHQVGDISTGLRKLDAAAAWTARLDDAALRQHLDYEIARTRGALLVRTAPSAAIENISRAIESAEERDDLAHLPLLYADRAAAHRVLGEHEAARRDLLRGVREIVARRTDSSDVDPGDVLSSDHEPLFQSLIALELEERRNPAAAFGYLERSRTDAILAALDGKRCSDASTSRPPSLTLDEVVGRLAPGTTLTSIAPVGTDGGLVAWVVSDAGSRLVEYSTTQREIERLLDRLELARRGDGAAGSEIYSASLAQLHDALIRPLDLDASDRSRLVVAADGVLARIPYATLYDARSGEFLVERHEIAVTSSASLYLHARERARAKRAAAAPSSPSAIALGNPTFDTAVAPELAHLGGAEREAGEVVRLHGGELLTGAAATEGAFLARAGEYPIVHFAGHTLLHPTDPALSRLLLSPGGGDGALHAREVAAACFPDTELVVLSSCSSAAGARHGDESALGLGRAFHAADVPAVVGTLWEVDDASSGELARILHRRLAAGDGPARALRAAQLELLRHSERATNPAVWGAYQLLAG